LPGSLARQPCPAALPGSLARQTCPVALAASLAEQFASCFTAVGRHACSIAYFYSARPAVLFKLSPQLKTLRI
jgi:hypothetical protein